MSFYFKHPKIICSSEYLDYKSFVNNFQNCNIMFTVVNNELYDNSLFKKWKTFFLK